jgi:hypothetical protein
MKVYVVIQPTHLGDGAIESVEKVFKSEEHADEYAQKRYMDVQEFEVEE